MIVRLSIGWALAQPQDFFLVIWRSNTRNNTSLVGRLCTCMSLLDLSSLTFFFLIVLFILWVLQLWKLGLLIKYRNFVVLIPPSIFLEYLINFVSMILSYDMLMMWQLSCCLTHILTRLNCTFNPFGIVIVRDRMCN